MEEFFPSEIARLVLGYLKETNCQKSWKIFIGESSSLSEYFDLFENGKLYPTNVNGKSLLDILNEYCSLKKKAMVESQRKNEEIILDNITINRESVKKIVKKAVDHAFQQYLSSVNKDISGDRPTGETEMNENADDLHDGATSTTKNSEKNTLNTTNEIASCISPQISITEITSLNNMDSSKAVTCSNSKYDSHFPPGFESPSLTDVIKIEDEDDILITNFVSGSQNKSVNMSNDIIQCQDIKSVDNCNVNELNANTISSNCSKKSYDFALPNIKENVDLSAKLVNDIDLRYLANTKKNFTNDGLSNHNVEKNDTSLHSKNIAPSSVYLFDNNLEIQQMSSLDSKRLAERDNATSTLNSSNNPSNFIIGPTSISNQCSTASLTYIVPNYSSNGCFVQNNSPYHIVINNPMTIPVSNISNPTFTDSNNNNEKSLKVLDSPSVVSSTQVETTKSKSSVAVIETSKRKNKEEFFARKKVNSCVESPKESILVPNKKKKSEKPKLVSKPKKNSK